MPRPPVGEPTRVDVESSDGLRVVAYRWDPSDAPRAVVQLTHGMGEHAMRYAPLAGALTERGYVVYAQDHRGHGRTAVSEDRLGQLGDEGWDELVGDIDRLRTRAVEEHPGLPVVVLGHSMGSFALQQYLLDHSRDLTAAVLTGTAAIDLLEPALDLDRPIDLSGFNARFEPARTAFDWLSRDQEQVDRYLADPHCGFGLDTGSGKAMFVRARRLASPEEVARIRHDLPLYVAVGTEDPVGGDLALVTALVDRLERAGLTEVELVTYPGARHEILNETNRDQVVSDLLAWLDRVLAGVASDASGRPRAGA